MRYFIELAYLGTAYHGWQKQPNANSVQETLEITLSRLMQVTTEIVGAGRTDAGVHARQIFAHFDSDKKLNTGELVFKLNSMLPKDMAILGIFEVRPNAHARFDAVSRSYEYHVVSHKDPFSINRAYYLKRKPNLAKMNEAAALLSNYVDFKCFSKSRTDVKTYNCQIISAKWEEKEGNFIFSIKANRFLRNMVRAIVGTLLEIGLGKLEISEISRIIKSRDRGRAGASVPACGLYLTKVEYSKIAV